MNSKDVYLVTFDGWMSGYGSHIYLLGIYSTEEEANKAAQELKEREKYYDDMISVDCVCLDHTYDVKKDRWTGDYTSAIYLGGYAE